jgi:4-hydroxybenzoate polyprenyltransferase
LNGLTRSLLFGNYFYGLCTVALSIEAILQQQYPLNSIVYYVFVFCATVLYYTHAYIAEPTSIDPANMRSAWYHRHRRFVKYSQVVMTLMVVLTGAMLLIPNWNNILHISWLQGAVGGIFPLVAVLYYGSLTPGSSTNNLRNQGWIKPFVIGLVWAGPVTLYPVLFQSIEKGIAYEPGLVGFLLFIKNFMFITMLCIMFDIKDYAADHNQNLKTFVVQLGLRKTIFYILIPLSALGLGTFIMYAMLRHFPLLRILVNTIPFILLITVAYSMHRRKSILYYLAIIDGLMLAKAVCGTIGITLIK